jgi:Flp pilus assembly protein TadD
VKAHTVLAQQDYELASRFLERILAQDPRNVEARELLGMCDLELGNVEEARAVSLALPPSPSPHPLLAC